jgi:hypothetical protein
LLSSILSRQEAATASSSSSPLASNVRIPYLLLVQLI